MELGFDPFDVTKVWPRDKYPVCSVIRSGSSKPLHGKTNDRLQMQEFEKLHVTKNPENYHRDVEQAAFSPGHGAGY